MLSLSLSLSLCLFLLPPCCCCCFLAMASLPETPVPDAAPPVTPQGESPAPPGWQRKVVERKGKGQTPRKSDVVYVAPDGEEIKSKTHLQRYLKTHPGGPAVSDFNWSSGETPTRRSERLITKITTENMEADVTPKRSKRSAAQISQEMESEDQVTSTPSPKRGKRTRKGTTHEGQDTPAVVAPAIVSGQEETMQDVEKDKSGDVAGHSVEGDLEVHGKQEEKATEEKGPIEEKEATSEKGAGEDIKESSAVVEKIEEVFEEGNQTGEKLEEEPAQPPEPISAVAAKAEGLPDQVHAQSTKGLDEKMDTVPEPLAIEPESGEPLQPLPSKSLDILSEVKGTSEIQEPPVEERKNADSLTEDVPREEEQKKPVEEANYSSFLGVAQGQEKGASQGDVYRTPAPVGVTN